MLSGFTSISTCVYILSPSDGREDWGLSLVAEELGQPSLGGGGAGAAEGRGPHPWPP